MRFIHYAANTQLFIRSFFSEQMQRNKNFSFFNINPSFPSKEAYQIAKNNIDFLVFFCFLPIEPSFPPIRSNTNNTFLYIRSLLYFIYSIIYFSVKLQIFPLPHTSESLTFLKYNKLTI